MNIVGSVANKISARECPVALLIVCGLMLLVAAGCGGSSDETRDHEAASEHARAYLDEALDIMQEHSLNREEIDWSALREHAMSRAAAAEARRPEDTYGIIEVALHELGDGHSFFLPPDAATEATDSDDSLIRPEALRLGEKENLGYVRIPAFRGSGESAIKFANVLQGEIERVNAEGVCGWTVDLRKNFGGNMWPMLAGVGPILGEGLAGFFVEPDGSRQAWYYEDSASRIGQKVMVEVTGSPYRGNSRQPPVAVLIGPQTASSGEAVAVAFRGREQTRFFGEATAGLSTSNEGFRLPDGARIVLTTATFADRTGEVYGEPLQPDENISSGSSEPPVGDDPLVEAALGWLQGQDTCAAGDL